MTTSTEQTKKYNKHRYDKNKPYWKQYYKEHEEHIRAYQKEYQRAYRERNRERLRNKEYADQSGRNKPLGRPRKTKGDPSVLFLSETARQHYKWLVRHMSQKERERRGDQQG